ncbi:MAG: glutathione S-transferase N-terminal domain-containing protein [Woeseiaceae bacterium]|nr:glutathione S-transferase N-terminal domain-containing protein [Woeseiaceae bacterium]
MPELTLFFSPRACSLACHIALEESGLPFTARMVKIREGEHRKDEYLKINPWGKIPALRVDNEVLTEAHAILSLIGDLAPADKAMIPRDDPLQRARAHEWMNFLSGTVHIAFRPLFRPYYLIADETLYPKLREVGVPNYQKTLLEVEKRLQDKVWALGEQYSVVDPYLFVFYMWSQRQDVVEYSPPLPAWKQLWDRLYAREATQRALNTEGVTPDNIWLA